METYEGYLENTTTIQSMGALWYLFHEKYGKN